MARWGAKRRRDDRGAPLPPSICLLPWLNLSIDVDGSSRPCCKFDHLTEIDGHPLLNLEGSSLAEVWHSPGLIHLREQFRRGVRPAGCASCWAEEDAGVVSFRQSYLQDRGMRSEVDVSDDRPAQPKGLDLKLSNTCNLACRICGPVASSRWLTEEIAEAPDPPPAGSFVAFLTDNRRYLADQKLTGHPDDRRQLEDWATEIEHLELTGGEPMLSKESAEVLEILVEKGRPENVTLQITTNATTISDRITAQLPRFGRVGISLSVDDVGPRFEYQRSPARWDEVRDNIDRYAALATGSCEVYLNATVSTYNVWDLPEYLGWWLHHHGADGKVGFALNFVHHPEEMSIRHVPEPVKPVIAQHWQEHPTWSDRTARGKLEQVVAFMDATTADEHRWASFIDRTRSIDRRRGQRFDAVYPEFHAMLREHGWWPEP